MPTEGQIGIYWGSQGFSIVENISGRVSNVFQLPFDTEIKEGEEAVPDQLKFPTLIKQTLEFRSIKSKTVNLSLPTTDLIFRSFEIPFMEKNEISNVVEFEITKYIPLKLDDLVYTYHTVPSGNAKQKSLNVLFVAVRRSRLEEMAGSITPSGLTLKHVEPAPVSLIHLMKRYKIISKKDSVALIEIGTDNSEIVIIEDETINFMRRLDVSFSHVDPASIQNALLNEIRVSFNFYSRQHPSSKVSKIIIISEQGTPDIETVISKELDIPASFLPIENYIKEEDCRTIPNLIALGSTFRKGNFSPKYFDLSAEAVEIQHSGRDPLEMVKRQLMTVGIGLASIVVVLLTVLVSNKMLSSNYEKEAALKMNLGAFEALTEQNLNEKKEAVINDIKAFTSVRFDSNLATIMSKVSELLPEGTWLTAINVRYTDKKNAEGLDKIELSLTGKIYSPDSNDQFRILNKLIEDLKQNEILSKLFDTVSRDSANRIVEKDYTVTVFQITCK